MSIITFTDDGINQTGKTLSAVAIATYMALEHSSKILILSTAYKNQVLERAYFPEEKKKATNMGMFGMKSNVYNENGLEGIATIMRANKLSPDIISNYTRVVYKDNRLDVLKSFSGAQVGYDELKDNFPKIIQTANKFYDFVFVDLEKDLGEKSYNQLLEDSTIIIYVIQQGLDRMQEFINFRKTNPIYNSQKSILQIGRYDKWSKFNIKNLTRTLNEKNKILAVPYNTSFFEACDESTVPDLFLSLMKEGIADTRTIGFKKELKRCTDNILFRISELQKRR